MNSQEYDANEGEARETAASEGETETRADAGDGGVADRHDETSEGDQDPERDATPEDAGEEATEDRTTEGAEAAEAPTLETAAEGEEDDGGAEEPSGALELRAERDRLKDQHLRLAADFNNYRKRTDDRLRLRWDRAQADQVSRLLDPLDDLLRVTALDPESNSSVEAIVEGVDLVERKFFRVLEDAGVEIVDPEGESFDPNTMEAMMSVPTDSEEDDETVAMVFQRGYTLKGMLIRAARVSVFKCQ